MVLIQLWQNSRCRVVSCCVHRASELHWALTSTLYGIVRMNWHIDGFISASLSSFSSHRLAFCFHQSPSSCPCTLLLFISIFQSLSHHLRLTIIIYSLLNMIQVTDDLLQCNNSPPLQKETGFIETSLAADRADISIGSGIEWEEKWHHYTWVCIGVCVSDEGPWAMAPLHV